jgi:hypothetical protein
VTGAELSPDERERWEVARRRTQTARTAYEPFLAIEPLKDGEPIPAVAFREAAEAQAELEAAQRAEAELRKEFFG